MKTGEKPLLWLLGIAIVIGIIYWIYTQGYLAKYGFGTVKIKSQGEESFCNDTGNDPNGRVNAKLAGTCFPPVAPQFYLVFSGGPKGDVKEREWTASELGNKADLFRDITSPNSTASIQVQKPNGQYTKWTFNQIRKDDTTGTEYFLFVDNPAYRNYNDYPKA